ncbi:hypothetical protein EV121DRAFT_284834 [Schizophyllum commune]
MSDETVRAKILAATPEMRPVRWSKHKRTLPYASLLMPILFAVFLYGWLDYGRPILADIIERAQDLLAPYRWPDVDVRHPILENLLPDYAYQPAGGRIAHEFTSPTLDVPKLGTVARIFDRVRGYDRRRSSHSKLPTAVISCRVEVGCCWRFAGSYGHVGLRLLQPVAPSGVTLFYPGTNTLPGIHHGEIPRSIKIWGIANNSWANPDVYEVRPLSKFYQSPEESGYDEFDEYMLWDTADYAFVLLADFEHVMRNTSGYHHEVIADIGLVTNVIVVEVVSNWGVHSNTSLYRIAVHGNE